MALVTPEQVTHIARLSRLQLTSEEITRYAAELSTVFSFVEQLAAVDTTDVGPTVQVTGIEQVVRPDVVRDSSSELRQALLAAFPESLGSRLSVRAVFTDVDR